MLGLESCAPHAYDQGKGFQDCCGGPPRRAGGGGLGGGGGVPWGGARAGGGSPAHLAVGEGVALRGGVG